MINKLLLVAKTLSTLMALVQLPPSVNSQMSNQVQGLAKAFSTVIALEGRQHKMGRAGVKWLCCIIIILEMLLWQRLFHIIGITRIRF